MEIPSAIINSVQKYYDIYYYRERVPWLKMSNFTALTKKIISVFPAPTSPLPFILGLNIDIPDLLSLKVKLS